MHRRLCCSFLLCFSLTLFLAQLQKAHAKNHSPKTEAQNRLVPFETKMDLGFLGIFGASMIYTFNGEKIVHYRDFKKILYPLHDGEASKLIRDAESADTISWVLFAMGIPLGIDVTFSFKPVPLIGIDWIDRILSGFAAAQVFLGTGLVFESNAEGMKYNAVQRYNHLVENKETSKLQVTPELFVQNGHLGLGLGYRF